MESRPLIGGANVQTFSVSNDRHSVDFQTVTFDSRDYDIKVIDQPEDWSGGGRITGCMREAGAVAGVNGGFFSPQFTPMGLMIANGRKTGSWQANKLLSGAVVVNHTSQLLWNAEVGHHEARELIQAGPRLVDSGQPVVGLERSRHTSRTFVATDGNHHWIIGTAQATSLGELAEILAIPGIFTFPIYRALNLDGGHSSAIYYHTADGREHSDPGWSTVRNYLGIVPRGMQR